MNNGHRIDDGHIGDFRPDEHNARQHNPRNVGMIEHALQRVGAGRSLVATRDGTIIAGNATLDAATAAGIEHAIVVHSSGDALIIHQRDDIETGSTRATELGILDNRSAELATWDVDILQEIKATHTDLIGSAFSEKELNALFGGDIDADSVVYDPESVIGQLEYRVVVDCASEGAQAELIAEFQARGLSCRALIS